MFLSKFLSKLAMVAVCWQISLAACIMEDTGDCAAFPKEDASLGQHAMLQQTGKASKGHVLVDSAVTILQPDSPAVPMEPVKVSTFENSVPTGSMSSQTSAMQEFLAESCDWQCYLDRYPDLQGSVGARNVEAAEQHWNTVGKSEGRDCKCDVAQFSTGSGFASLPTAICDWQCYLNRYPDLKGAVGTNVAAAEQHWNSVGKSEGRDCTCTAGESFAVGGTTQEAVQPLVSQAATAEESSAAVGGTTQEAMQPIVSQAAAAENPAAVVDGMTKEAVQPLEIPAVNAEESLAVVDGSIDAATACEPYTEEAKAMLAVEIQEYEVSDKFQEKISEAQGTSPASAGHVGIMKYLRENVLKPGYSILELGAGAGGMLRFIQDEYDFGWGEVDYAEAVPHGSLVGVELVPGWVKFAQEEFKNISFYQGDITEYSLPEPYSSTPFDLVLLNDVMEHVQKTRYGCFFSHLDKVTSAGSLVYMHTPSPMAQLEEKKSLLLNSTQTNENVVPHHFVVSGMANIGFELLAFDYDLDTVCGGEGASLPRQLEGAHCYYNGWPKYTHNLFRKAVNPAVLNMS